MSLKCTVETNCYMHSVALPVVNEPFLLCSLHCLSHLTTLRNVKKHDFGWQTNTVIELHLVVSFVVRCGRWSGWLAGLRRGPVTVFGYADEDVREACEGRPLCSQQPRGYPYDRLLRAAAEQNPASGWVKPPESCDSHMWRCHRQWFLELCVHTRRSSIMSVKRRKTVGVQFFSTYINHVMIRLQTSNFPPRCPLSL